jgi:hypothetical protein
MHRTNFALALSVAGALALGGCAPAAQVVPSLVPTAPVPASMTPVPPQPTAAPTESLTELFPYGAFSEPTTVDNEWFPLVPGTQWVWEGEVNGDEARVPHRVVFTVTDLTKVIDGIRTVVAYDEDFTEGELVEAELAFFAQDDDGTVWHLGQYPEEHEDGEFADAPAWIAGIEGARAGITMNAEPRFSEFSYSQGWGPEVEYTDRARVLELDSETCVPAGCYEGVLVIAEFNPEEPDVHQLKYYAAGVGGVRVGSAGALDQDQEVLELISIETLDSPGLEALRSIALEMDARAYQLSPDVYGETKPAEPAG